MERLGLVTFGGHRIIAHPLSIDNGCVSPRIGRKGSLDASWMSGAPRMASRPFDCSVIELHVVV